MKLMALMYYYWYCCLRVVRHGISVTAFEKRKGTVEGRLTYTPAVPAYWDKGGYWGKRDHMHA
jgi:hypothetical protein